MKKELLAGITIFLLLVASISNVIHLTNTVSDITDRIDNAAYAIDMGDYAYAAREVTLAHTIWNNADTHTNTLLRHADVGAVMENFYDAISAAGKGEYYEAKYALETLRSRLNTILDMEQVSLHSVF